MDRRPSAGAIANTHVDFDGYGPSEWLLEQARRTYPDAHLHRELMRVTNGRVNPMLRNTPELAEAFRWIAMFQLEPRDTACVGDEEDPAVVTSLVVAAIHRVGDAIVSQITHRKGWLNTLSWLAKRVVWESYDGAEVADKLVEEAHGGDRCWPLYRNVRAA